ncbi:DUF1622 domain-containing protein [Leucobacter soli]|uniref:DUF1622 domain-containing protein n=2 Tax=Leucobacter soli TaxID=2812850 RepID=A0A916K1C8_9MICO|nr:hypothetical protein LEUCIP111803_02342 [Leucobacter soli]
MLFDATVLVVEVIGVVALLVGFGIAGVLSARALLTGRGGRAAFQTLRTSLGGSILLGLEIFVAADIIRTISTPTLEDALILGLIVIIRTVLSMSIQIEIDGVVPWRRALLTSGGQVLAQELSRAHEGARAPEAAPDQD